ncbi:50S ribosomal protein L9 [Oricola cellulosilytica]|uniref:Large ribosomal subunit protein bL9 n=1 Tax=Oricola cellulosilytica TaxID=1429082 RepID=A0A4R0PFN0_9HYPH|nr:50S ribosomal protein L9 [Oricola cellulosilytica]TCD14294.1 50S ribosomal protein L9 [Oricola cellulosilytica]
MQVILLERIARLGQIGDEVAVKDGFARNYLLPTGRALRANAANRTRFEAERAQIEARNAERKSAASEIAERLNGKTIVVVRSAGETGQLYGSVSTRDIADILTGEGFDVSRNQVDLKNPIKAIGLHEIEIVLHPEVETKITLNVARSSDEAERQAAGEDLSSAEAIYGVDEDAQLQTYDPEAEEFFEEGASGPEKADDEEAEEQA